MKRTPLKRTPIRKRNEERLARIRGDEVYGEQHEHVKTLPCLLAHEGECSGIVDSHHVVPVSRGGRDAANTVPLCRRHHDEIDDVNSGPLTFQLRHDIDLKAEARRIWRESPFNPENAE